MRALTAAVEAGEGGDEAALLLASVLDQVAPHALAAAKARRLLGSALSEAEMDWRLKPSDEATVEEYVRLALLAGKPATALEVLLNVQQSR